MDYRKMYDDKDFLYAFNLDGDRTLEISSVSRGEVTGENNRKSKKPILTFVGEAKKLALNKTNGKIVSKLYSKETESWIGKRITIYPTTTTFGPDTVDCIRVRPAVPTVERKPGEHRQTRAERNTAEQSAIAAKYLVDAYDACDSDERMAELKIQRGKTWDVMNAEDRQAVTAAATEARARIDAAVSSSPPVTGAAQ